MILEGACGEGKVTKLRDELQKLAENGRWWDQVGRQGEDYEI